MQPILRWPRINQRHKKYQSFVKSNCSQISGKPNEVRGREQVMCDYGTSEIHTINKHGRYSEALAINFG